MRKVTLLSKQFLMCLALYAFCIPSSHALFLKIVGGQLQGVTELTVAGVGVYNVDFKDGKCATLFNGCNESNDFEFSTEAEAGKAALALMQQVFLDTPSGAFDTNPFRTRGCQQVITGGTNCDAIVPYDIFTATTGPNTGKAFVKGVDASNAIANAADSPMPNTGFQTITSSATDDLVNAQSETWAVFSLWQLPPPPPPIVAEPTTVALFGLALAGLGFLRRKGVGKRTSP